MKHLLAAAISIVFLCIVAACDKAPNGVIPESKMEDLLVDIELADAYIEAHWDEFPNDSSRLLLKQSILAKHGITPELYDTSLVWYARNMDVYIKVYDNVIARLQDMDKDGNGGDFTGPRPFNETMAMEAAPAAPQHDFKATGDSADLWKGQRRWMLAKGFGAGYITFDLTPDEEYAKGDRYELQFKLKPVRSSFKSFIAVDYADGSSTIVNRYMCGDGWNMIPVQSDSSRIVRRIYGYVGYRIMDNDIAYVDSLLLLRTHIDRKKYNDKVSQRLIERVKRNPAPESNASTPAPDAKPNPQSQVPTVQPTGSFKPKEGVNKSSAQRHVTQSPNSDHLPKK